MVLFCCLVPVLQRIEHSLSRSRRNERVCTYVEFMFCITSPEAGWLRCRNVVEFTARRRVSTRTMLTHTRCFALVSVDLSRQQGVKGLGRSAPTSSSPFWSRGTFSKCYLVGIVPINSSCDFLTDAR